jgi:hypothetical protein
MYSEADVCFDPALFPRGRSLFREGYAIHSRIAAGITEQTPRMGVFVFPAPVYDLTAVNQRHFRHFQFLVQRDNTPRLKVRVGLIL